MPNCTNTPYEKKEDVYEKADSPINPGIDICSYIALEQEGLLKTENDKFILTYI